VTKSKQELWPNFFNSLRASTLTDLMDQHGLRKACKWAGNSAAVAMKCYALTRSDDFDDNRIMDPYSAFQWTILDLRTALKPEENAALGEKRRGRLLNSGF